MAGFEDAWEAVSKPRDGKPVSPESMQECPFGWATERGVADVSAREPVGIGALGGTITARDGSMRSFNLRKLTCRPLTRICQRCWNI